MIKDMLSALVAIWYTFSMISLDHAEKITTVLLWLGGLAAVLCFPLWYAPLVLLVYLVVVGPWLVVLLPVLVTTAIGGINLVLWFFSRLTGASSSDSR